MAEDITINKLWATIRRIFSNNYDKARCKQMIESYKKSGLTYEDIEDTLVYWFEIKNNTTDRSVTHGAIGIVPHVYEEAKRYWEEQDRLVRLRQEVRKQQQQPTQTVTARVTSIKKPLNIYYFDLSKIGTDTDE